MSWQEALAFASRPNGIAAIVGFGSAWLAENWGWYQQKTPKAKRLLYGLFCILVPVLAATAVWCGGYAPLTWEGLYWPAVQAGFLAFVAGQGTHAVRYMGQNK